MTDESESPQARLQRAYDAALFCLWIGDHEIRLRVGKRDSSAMALLQRRAGLERHGYIITPCNPFSERLSAADNHLRLQEFRKRLTADAIRWLPAVNLDPNDDWPSEPGALLIDCSQGYARRLGRELQQNAVLALAPDKAPQLMWLV